MQRIGICSKLFILMFQKLVYAAAYVVWIIIRTAYVICGAVCGRTVYAAAYAAGGPIYINVVLNGIVLLMIIHTYRTIFIQR